MNVDVVEGDVGAEGVVGDAGQQEGDGFGVGGFEVFDLNVADLAGGFGFVAVVEGFEACAEAEENRRVDVVHGDVGDEDVLDDSAVDGEEFDAAEVGVVDLAVGDLDIFEVAEGFGAELDGGAVGLECAVVDGDVGVGGGAGGFEAEGVVVGVDVAVGDVDGVGGVDVDAVVVGVAAVEDGEVVDGDVFGVGDVHAPHGGGLEVDAFDGDVVGADPADEEGAEAGGFAIDGEVGFLELGALAVDGAFAFEGDVSGIDGAEEEEAGGFAGAFVEEVDGAVVGDVGGAEEDGVFVEVEGDVVFEEEGAGEVLAGGEFEGAAAGLGAVVDGVLEGGGVEGFGVGGEALDGGGVEGSGGGEEGGEGEGF